MKTNRGPFRDKLSGRPIRFTTIARDDAAETQFTFGRALRLSIMGIELGARSCSVRIGFEAGIDFHGEYTQLSERFDLM